MVMIIEFCNISFNGLLGLDFLIPSYTWQQLLYRDQRDQRPWCRHDDSVLFINKQTVYENRNLTSVNSTMSEDHAEIKVHEDADDFDTAWGLLVRKYHRPKTCTGVFY